MPRHDYVCSDCRTVLRDQYRSIEQGGAAHPPRCPSCFAMMTWIIPVPRMDLRSDGEGSSGARFQKFTVRDGLNRLVEVDSLHKVREIERESAKMAADGIGQPILFRGFAQDHSNMGVNLFGDGPSEKPEPKYKQKFGLQGGASAVAPTVEDGVVSDPDYSYGPGVDDSNTSPLKESA